MDCYPQASPRHLLNTVEQRKSARKKIRRQVIIDIADHGIIRGSTVDISVGGLSVMIPVALAANSRCSVRFELLIDGALVRFAGIGQVANCSCVGMQGFRIGMKFEVKEPKLLSVLTAFVSN
jgi:PilZ domain